MRRSHSIVLLVVGLILMVQQPTSAQGDLLSGLVGVALLEFGGNKVGDIIKQLQNTGEQFIREGGNTSNSLLVTAGSEMQALLTDASFILGDSQDRLYRDLSFNQQAVLAVVLQLREEMHQSRDFVRDFADSTTLNISQLVERIPFVKDQFFIQSLRGMVLLHKTQGEFHFRVFGTRLQPYLPHRSVVFELKACDAEHRCDHAIPIRFTLGSPESSSADLFVPSASLEQYFQQDRMVVLEAQLSITFSRTRRGRVETEAHPVPVHFSLFPELAGTGEANTKTDEFDWRPTSPPERIYADPNPLVTDDYDCYTRPHDDCDHPDHYRKSLTLPRLVGGHARTEADGPAVGARRYSDVRLTCGPPDRDETRRVLVGGGGGGREGSGREPRYVSVPVHILSPCIWSNIGAGGDAVGRAWHYVDVDHTEVVANVDTFSHPATITFSGVVEEYKKVGEKPWSSGKVEFYYGRTMDVIVPAHYTSMPHFVGETLQHGKFDFVLGQADASGVFRLAGLPERMSDGRYVVHYSVARPDWDMWS